ncbi:uncharacterized protein LOC129602769 [Paramacrobiotus metropolitanus]|uniref:uncharacterized protein LOC129602769 n=1 Tax=Paramacrobiotus metropolitanus TaxID=2943436 RepID=UPI0024457E9C|nr:uncharacterized protein LOC129602769 [Paramacrobiotus metropolitanus]
MASGSKASPIVIDGAPSSNPVTHPLMASLNTAAAQFANIPGAANQQKYSLLLATIDEIGKQIRPAHTLNKNAMEQMKRHIAFAKLLIRELMAQVDMNLSTMAARERKESGFMPSGSTNVMVRKKPPTTTVVSQGVIRNNN